MGSARPIQKDVIGRYLYPIEKSVQNLIGQELGLPKIYIHVQKPAKGHPDTSGQSIEPGSSLSPRGCQDGEPATQKTKQDESPTLCS